MSSEFAINITAVVPGVYRYEDGKVFCNDTNGCEAVDSDTGSVLTTWSGTVDWEPWALPDGVTHVIIRPKTGT